MTIQYYLQVQYVIYHVSRLFFLWSEYCQNEFKAA